MYLITHHLLRILRSERGQALILALGFMFLSVPLVTAALGLASTLTIDARLKHQSLRSQYSAIGAEQFVFHSLVTTLSEATSTITLNGSVITTTIIQLDAPPGDIPFPTSADANRRMFTSKSASPTSVSSSATTTYTITVENKDDKSVSPNKIIDELPNGFSYVTGSTDMKNAGGSTISTADPSTSGQQLTWNIPSGNSLSPGQSMTLEFIATAAAAAGVYCNEAYAQPGGKTNTSGKTAKVTVSSTSSTLCEGAAFSITKTVDEDIVFSDTATTYTYTISMVNEGTDVLNVSQITDTTCSGAVATCEFTYVPLSAASSGVTATPAELVPTTNVNQQTIKWSWGGGGKQLPTSTTWTLTFEATATLARGQFPDETSVKVASVQLPDQTTWPTAVVTVVDVYRITVTDGESTYECHVWLGADLSGNPFTVKEDCALAS